MEATVLMVSVTTHVLYERKILKFAIRSMSGRHGRIYIWKEVSTVFELTSRFVTTCRNSFWFWTVPDSSALTQF